VEERGAALTFVVDASATIAWVNIDERTPAIEAMFDLVVEQGAIAPALWALEVANGLTIAMRRKRMTAEDRAAALADLARVNIGLDDETNTHAWGATLALADLYGLTLYDAAYLELAQRRRLPLVTLDGELARVAKSAGVEVRP